MVVASSPPFAIPSVAPRIAQRPNAPVTQVALDTTLIFNLIDSYFPFEVCLHYQLLPLRVDRDHMHLGMVDPDDRPALEYAVRMAQYWNYRLIPKPIALDRLNTLLSAYLNFMQLQGPRAYQEKLRLASQIARTSRQSEPKPTTYASTPASLPSLPQLPKPMIVINDETLILDESEMMAIEAHNASVIPLAGTVDPNFTRPAPSHRSTSPTPPSSPPAPLAMPVTTPMTMPAATPSATAITTPSATPITPPTPTTKPIPATQQQLDQLGKTALHFTRQLRQAMDALQSYGTAHPVEAQHRQQAIVALGRDLHQINQDFKTLLQAIAVHQVF